MLIRKDGSSSVITDDTGNTKETIDYDPFGTYRARQDKYKSSRTTTERVLPIILELQKGNIGETE